MNSHSLTTAQSGLEGVVAAETRLSRVDGERGELLIGGFPLEILAPNATFLEAVYLLWHGHLPSAKELESFDREVRAQRTVSPATHELLVSLTANSSAAPMDWLRSAAASLSVTQATTGSEAPLADATRILAVMPTLIARSWRLHQGLDPIEPDGDLGHAANYLYMLEGRVPDVDRARALETYLNTVIDHGMNASTFSARVIISTHTDLVSAIVGAIGALKGPLHGGAPGPALDMVFEIGSPERAEAVLRDKIGSGERLMGFGHRVYKVRDPRAEVLSAAVETLVEQQKQRESAEAGDLLELYGLTKAVEATAIRVLEELKPGRRLSTNVEFYTALLLHGIGLPRELFTPTFALARTGGWCAHAFEQLANGRLIRPRAQYTGETYTEWPKISTRG